MSRKIKIEQIFSNNKKQIVETYYIINLLQELNSLAANEKQQVNVLSTNSADFKLVAKLILPS
jgi:hypothetical protein